MGPTLRLSSSCHPHKPQLLASNHQERDLQPLLPVPKNQTYLRLGPTSLFLLENILR